MSAPARAPERERSTAIAEQPRRWGRAGAPAIREAHAAHPDVLLRDRLYRRALVTADAVAALLALLLCAAVVPKTTVSASVLFGLPLIVLACKVIGLYDRDALLIRKTTLDEAPKLLELATLATLAVWMADRIVFGRDIGTESALLLFVALLAFSVVCRRVAREVAGRRAPIERLLVVGSIEVARRLQDKLAMTGAGAELVGRVSLRQVASPAGDERAIDRDTFREMLRDMNIHRVLVEPSQTNPQVTVDMVRGAKAAGVRVSIVPHVFDVVGNSVVFDDLSGMTVLGVREFELSRSSHLVKRGFDVLGAGLLLFCAAPAMLLIAAAIKADSRGPVFFRQERVGKAARRFRIFKFRTMVVDAEELKVELAALNEADGLFKIADDPRITRVGRLLRRTSLDELPQLLNVLRGEMSLVGPRPLICAEDETITGYDRRRLRLTPGMTGHWQIMGSSRVPLHEMVKIDYVYVTTWSLFEDLKILVRTIPYMLARRGM